MRKTKGPSRGTAWAVAALALSAILLTSCGGELKERIKTMKENRKQTAAEKPAKGTSGNVETIFAVNTTTAVAGEILDYIEINGDVVTRTSVDVYADTAGKLSRVLIRVGDAVRKDQVIAEVDPSRPGMNFVASPVKSPISGTVTALPGQVGATIAQGVPIARVGRLGDLEITTKIAERFISKMQLGLDAILRFDAYPEERFRASIVEVSPVVDPQTRTLEIRLRLVTPDSRIKSGMFGEVKIITQKKEGIVKVPAETLVKRYGVYYVFVIDNDKVERREVNPGIQIDDKVEITAGLAAGEEIVIRGQTLLEDGSLIRVIARVPGLDAEDNLR